MNSGYKDLFYGDITIQDKIIFNLFRFLGISAALSIIGYRWILPDDAIDPMWQRFTLSGIFILVVIASFADEKHFRRTMNMYVGGALYLITIWLLQLCWLNNLRPEYTFSYFATLFVMLIAFSRLDGLVYFAIFNFLLAMIVVVMVPQPLFEPKLFIGMLFFLLSLSTVSFGYFLRSFRKVENSAETYQSLSRAAFEVNRDAIIVLNKDDLIEDFNKEIPKLWGLSSPVTRGIHITQLAREGAKILADPLQLKVKDGWNWPLDATNPVRYWFQDGRIIELETRKIAVAGNQNGTILFFRDQTHIIQKQKEMEQSSAVLRATFELSGLGILVTRKGGKVIFYNDTYLKLFKMTSDFLLQNPPEDVISYCQSQIKNQTEISDAMDQLIKDPEFDDSRLLEFQDGKLVQRSTRKMDIDGQPIGRVWFYRDITQNIKAEEELVKRNFELDSFVYRASHDLKAPISSLSGLIRLAKDEFKGENISSFLEMMGHNLVKLEDFIELLTDFSRNNRMDLVLQPLDMASVIEETKGKLRFLKEYDQVKINYSQKTESPFISDGARLKIILTNLIANSIRYSDLEKQHAYINITLEEEGPNHVIWVEDNGTGIALPYRAKIFDLFFRANAKSSGSGLGLYVVRNTVNRMGGTITLDETWENGTRFKISLPSS